jgi:hypothetical protein
VGTARRTQQHNRAFAVLLGTVPVLVFMIVIILVVFLHNEAAHLLAGL